MGDPGSIPESGRYPGEGNDNPLKYSCLENPMDRGAWQATNSTGPVKSNNLRAKQPHTFLYVTLGTFRMMITGK